jgi:hypothetical protein
MESIEVHQPARQPLIDHEKLAEAIFVRMQRYVDGQFTKRLSALPAPIIDLQEIAQRAAVLIPKPKDGQDGARGADGSSGVDGKSISPEDVEPIVARLVAKAMESIAKPRDGQDGRDGRDGTSVAIEAVATLVHGEVVKAVAALPKAIDGKAGERGEPGKDGQPGKDGERGRDGVDGKDGQPGRDGVDGRNGVDGKDGDSAVIDVEQVVEALKHDPEAVAMLKGERGLQGVPGDPGKPGDPGLNGKDGDPGIRGVDGSSVSVDQVRELVESRFNGWALEFERLATDRQRAAIDSIPLPRDGRDGEKGRDGFGFEDLEMDAETIDERNVRLTIRAGGREVSKTIHVPGFIDRGPWKSEAPQYERGDAVSYGGNLFIAQKDTKAKPGESADWRLAVRRGKDGKDAPE